GLFAHGHDASLQGWCKVHAAVDRPVPGPIFCGGGRVTNARSTTALAVPCSAAPDESFDGGTGSTLPSASNDSTSGAGGGAKGFTGGGCRRNTVRLRRAAARKRHPCGVYGAGG